MPKFFCIPNLVPKLCLIVLNILLHMIFNFYSKWNIIWITSNRRNISWLRWNWLSENTKKFSNSVKCKKIRKFSEMRKKFDKNFVKCKKNLKIFWNTKKFENFLKCKKVNRNEKNHRVRLTLFQIRS